MATEPGPETETSRRWFPGVEVNPERLVYDTVVILSVLAVYGGWDSQAGFLGAALVVVAPSLALMLAHGFADAVSRHITLHRALDRAQWRDVVRDSAQDLLVAVPFLLVVAVGWVSPLDAVQTISAILAVGVLILAGFGVTAGWHAGMRGLRLVAAGAAGASIGLLVAVLQILLKPKGY